MAGESQPVQTNNLSTTERQALVLANVKFAYKLANNWHRISKGGLDRNDLQSAAICGMMRAALYWDAERCPNFISYAWYHIRTALRNETSSQNNKGFTMVGDMRDEFRDATRSMTNEPEALIHGREPDPAILVENRDLAQHAIEQISSVRQRKVIEMLYQERKTITECARILKITPTRVHKMRKQAFKIMKEVIAAEASES